MSNNAEKIDLEPQYDPKKVEDRIYKLWENSGFFNPDNLDSGKLKVEGGKKKKTTLNTPHSTFTIVVPPPNITGSLHMGHALNATIQDILIRKKRMEGYKTLWLPGTDHAGIATQNVVEKDLKKQGISRHDLGREKFIEKIMEWKEKYGNIILDQFKKLGASMDWSRTRFTMDAEYQKAVEEAFIHYYKKGWIYQGERTVNWCSRCQTSLSDLELEYKEEKGKFYYIKYGPLTIGTVRPETKLGDTALAVNPKDQRYKKYVGKDILIQSVDNSIPRDKPANPKEIHIRVIADDAADPNFGTGIIKVTPAHDHADFEIWQRHQEVPILKVIGEKGRMTDKAGIRYEGMKILEAREQIVKDLTELGLIERIEDYAHNISLCYRCETVVEPLLSKQWFLKMKELAELAKKAVESGKVKFHPERWKNIFLDWIENIRDWNISRQIWWGHRVPIEGETDVLDTWFSSALWPLATLGWPQSCDMKHETCDPKNGTDLKEFYQTQVLSTARDIINLWVSRMIFSGLEFMASPPFSDVLVHATILTKDGKRMSKSLGTGIDPMTLIEKYGADATRFGLIWQSMGGQDIHWAEEHVVAGRKFCNKIWNITRFILLKTEGNLDTNFIFPFKNEHGANAQLHYQLIALVQGVNEDIEKFDFGQALHSIHEFVWHEFADKFIEYSKTNEDRETKQILANTLLTTLKLLHPFMPFITEEIWSKLPIEDKKMLIIESWPEQESSKTNYIG
ncbi:MAG: Valine-tRNA ligase [Parcubacteria group bacterium GW2011_GWA2_42_14]|nr:MAG: Valine-tRNA ligase [Parcubacteria group bacterium GW2011_GWA2_42_14]OHA00154.1 MAG: hypothetical protein A3D41_03650 [Candidatus Sungbacteria bacterium RIFCSPHIGHO2_02_FULL_41_12b]